MIYESVDTTSPIRQGDIFFGVPRVDFNADDLNVVESNGRTVVAQWDDFGKETEAVSLVVAARPVIGIVITQDCDAFRGRDITLCEIRPFPTVEGTAKGVTSPERMMKIITRQARANLKWFYLPIDGGIGFDEKMAVDFSVTLRMLRDNLENMRGKFRKGRLNEEAYQHFRERLSQYFRRYPYDEWYPLDQQEFQAYCMGSRGEEIPKKRWQNF